MNKQTNERMNDCSVSCWRRRGFLPWLRSLSPCAVTHKRERLEVEFGFQQTKNSFLISRNVVSTLLACATVARPSLRVRSAPVQAHATTNKGGNASGHLSNCIRVRRPGFPWRDISSRRDRLLGPCARPISSGSGEEGSEDTIGLVTALACNYSELPVVLEGRRKVCHGDNVDYNYI